MGSLAGHRFVADFWNYHDPWSLPQPWPAVAYACSPFCVLLAMRPIVSTAITPLWTSTADAYRMHLPIHVFGLVVGSSSRVLFCVVPAKPLTLVAAAVLSEALICHVIPLADTAVFIGLGRLQRPREEYAFQRLWGAGAAGT